MRKLFVARHGQDMDNANGILNGHRDQPLTMLGKKQAAELALKLYHKPVDVIVSSPLQRALLTASIVGFSLDKPVYIESGFIERDFGAMTGKRIADITKLVPAEDVFQTEKITYFLRAASAEPFPDLLIRVSIETNKVLEQYPGQNILIVAHGDVAKMIRAYLMGWSWLQGIQAPYFDNTEFVEFDIK
jgi:probable phosphoglycerate mutase